MFLKWGWLRALLFLTLLKISKCEEGGEEEEARLGNATGGIVEAVLRGAFYDADREVGLRGLVEDDGDGEDDDVGDISQEVPVPALSNSTLLRSLRSIKDGKTSSKKKLSSQKKEKKKSSKKIFRHPSKVQCLSGRRVLQDESAPQIQKDGSPKGESLLRWWGEEQKEGRWWG